MIGAGSAGSVVANRLSKHNKALLLEAGGDPIPSSIVPVGVFLTVISPSGIDWQYRTESQEHAAYSLQEQRIQLARAKALGGCSTINGMIYMRGSRHDFNNWANLTGDESWKYENLLPFFKNLESYEGGYPDSQYHGNGGPIYVQPLPFAPGKSPLLKAAREAGYNVTDLNAQYDGEAFMATDMTIKRGRRADTYRGYIQSILDYNNLKIYRFAHVIKVHLDRSKSAYGVTYVRHGVTKFVRADKEIIISAGAINSPHLLLLSGIGPKKHLNSRGLKCRVHLPVGQNLQNHPATFLIPAVVNESHSLNLQRDVSFSVLPDFLLQGQGNPSWPDIFLHQSALAPSLGSGPLIRVDETALGFKKNILADFLEPFEGKDAYVTLMGVGRPFSRGQIRLRSNDPFDKPLIDPNYLSDPRDVQILVEGIRKIRKIFNTLTFQRLNATIIKAPVRGCDVHAYNSEKYWECYVRTFTHTAWHPCCTCAMRTRQDNRTTGVIDSKLR